MLSLPFRSPFRFTLAGFFAAAALGGCGNGSPPIEFRPRPAGPPPYRISTEGFEPFSCEPLLAGAAAALGVDSIEVWGVPSRDADAPAPAPGGQPADSDGVPCASASDPDGCFASLAMARALTPQGGLPAPWLGPSARPLERLIVTARDAVTIVDERAELDALLGPLDAPEKLRFVVHYGGKYRSCEHVRRTDAGLELIVNETVGSCGVDTQRLLLEIAPGGAEALLDAEEVELGSGCV